MTEDRQIGLTCNRYRHPAKLAEDWQAEGRKLAIATVVQTWGSAPQPIGSQSSTSEGNFLGSCRAAASRAR